MDYRSKLNISFSLRNRLAAAAFSLCSFFFMDTLKAQEVAYSQADSFRVMNEARSHIELLASEDMHGRGYVENGHEKAATYVAQVFMAYGLKPWRPDSAFPASHFQHFSFPLNHIDNAEVSANGKRLRIGHDFIVAPASEAGKGKAEVIDLGYGLPSDFAAAKVKGKAVLVRSGLPENFSGSEAERKLWATEEHKAKLARESKAALLVFVHQRLTAAFAPENEGLPVIYLADSSMRRVMPRNFDFQISTAVRKTRSQNVIGWIEGTKVPDTALVICAHYDHLGRQGAAFFAGANDNASGTALLLSLAEHYSSNKPPYSLVFIAFGAEETGLNGSIHYVTKQPFWPLERTKAVLNFDLMGNGEDGLMMVGGKTWPRWHESVKTLNDSLQLVPRIDARPNAPNSDHYPFTLKNVPGLFFYTQGGSIHYHDVHDLPREIELPGFFPFRELLIHWIKAMPKAGL